MRVMKKIRILQLDDLQSLFGCMGGFQIDASVCLYKPVEQDREQLCAILRLSQ